MKLQKTLYHILSRNYKLIFGFVFLLFLSKIQAQEIQLNVIIDQTKYKLPGSDPIFTQMKSEIENFVNNKHWTKDEFEVNEKIQCNLLLTINENSTLTGFNCQAQVQSSRPVYGAMYQSVVLNAPDKNFNFAYTPGMQLEYNDNAYNNELCTLLAFYSYIMIGMDYDSFGANAGKSYFVLANQAMTNDPNTALGWSNSTNDVTSRYWLIENALNAQYLSFHQSVYTYHRMGLDVIATDKLTAQKNMLATLKEIGNLRAINQSSFLITCFMLAKRDELIHVFSGASIVIKQEVVPILTSLDPVNAEKYQKILI